MSYEIADAMILSVGGIKYNIKDRRYLLDTDWVDGKLNLTLSVLYKGRTQQSGKRNAHEILDRISRHFYNNVYDEKTWVEDFDKKQYSILTDENTVRVSRDIMLSHLESVVLTRRDLLVLEHGVDLDGMKLIEDFDKNMKKYQFSVDTNRMFNQDRNLRYLERLTNRVIDPSLIREGY